MLPLKIYAVSVPLFVALIGLYSTTLQIRERREQREFMSK